jgi:hypothetical protein
MEVATMKHLIEFPLEDGGSILIEVEVEETEGGIVPAARPGEIAAKAEQTFEAALDKVKPVASAVIAKLRDLSDLPDEVGVEFGIKLGAKAGAFIASADSEANFKVTLTWKCKREKKESKP